jgi:hypothetical protein
MLMHRTCCLWFIGLLLGLVIFNPLNPAPAGATWITVYENDFQTPVGSEWTSSGTAIHTEATPLPSDGSRIFLGQFSNDTVSLSLSGLPAHTQARLSFDLYVIASWDGWPSNAPIEIWDLSIAGGGNIIKTGFANIEGRNQYYPGTYPGGSNPARTGASENNTLGFLPYGDSVYNFSFEVPHSAGSVVFQFTASGLQDIADESWGLDNVKVEVVPLPSTLLLLGSGLLGLAGLRLRFRKG